MTTAVAEPELKIEQDMTVKQVAALLKVSPRTVRHEVQRGKLHASKQHGEWHTTVPLLKAYLGL